MTGPDIEIQIRVGDKCQATVLRRNPLCDLALLRVRRVDMPATRWADSSRLRNGEEVVAVGNPLGFGGALFTRIVHGVGLLRGVGDRNWVQAIIRLASGNSSGALANAAGDVMGINTMIAGHLGLAVPSNEVIPFVERAMLPQAPPIIGVFVEAVPFRVASKLAVGLRIQPLGSGGKAQVASLLPGDVIIRIDGQHFSSPYDLTDRLQKGRLVHLKFLRNGKLAPREIAIALAAAA